LHTYSQQTTNKIFKIVIDAGHGGTDTGTPGTGRYKTTEKDIALDVSLLLGKMINENIENTKVVYTRDKDIFPTLNSRAVITNKADADLFISIHCNAQPLKNRKKGGAAIGSETFVLGLHKNAVNLEVAKRENAVIKLEENYKETYEGFDPDSPESLIGMTLMQEEYLDQSIEIASYIENEFVNTAKRKSRGVKQAGFLVLTKTYMPSVLVELGFLTNLKEETFLNSQKGKDIMTLSLFKAINKYINKRANSEVSQENINFNSIYKDIIFKIQIAASSKNLPLKSYNFKGLTALSIEKDGNLFRYFTGKTNDYDLAKKIKATAVSKGYTKSYIVAFKNGKKITLSSVIN
jgi:N-acetylmuramoyl-L-alanine amidase